MDLLSRRTRRKRQRINYKVALSLLLAVVILILFLALKLLHQTDHGQLTQLSPENNEKSSSSSMHRVPDSLLQAALVEHETNKQKRVPHRLRKQNEDSILLLKKGSTNDAPLEDHLIPNILIFTHSTNLLIDNDTFNASLSLTTEEVALKRNVQNTIRFHPNATIRFLTDDDCLRSIGNVMGHDSALLAFFQNESEGMFKADICRGAALYETGGLYFDVDIQARMSMFDAISLSTEFCVPLVHVDSKFPGNYFQAFIGVTPQNPIMKQYLELFLQHYQGTIQTKGPLGVILLRMAHDQAKKHQKQITTQLWQEVLYRSQLFPKIPPPNWGTRRACKFVVVANRRAPYVVPLYSRTKGSRMCGGVDSLK